MTLQTLINHPKIVDKVKYWVSIQGAVGGCEIPDHLTTGWRAWAMPVFLNLLVVSADFVDSIRYANSIWEFFSRFPSVLKRIFWGGHFNTLKEMTTSERETYLANHLREIFNLNQKINVLSLGTHKPTENFHWSMRLIHWLFPNMFFGHPSDGLINPARSILYFSDYVIVEGLDHMDPVFGTEFPRSELLYTLFEMVLNRDSSSLNLAN